MASSATSAPAGRSRGWLPTLVLLTGFLAPAYAQDAATTGSSDAPTFSAGELESLVAPIALYPDTLLAQVLMASTYPLEIVEANRWVQQNAKLKGDALQDALEKQDWDPSVKSIAVVPDVLKMMDEKLDWTQKLGDAFLAQQGDVMAAVQTLRNKANDAGNLKSTKEQTVTTEPSATAPGQTTIVIQQSDPEVVYVPTYNPTVVYGTWGYPSYPPYYYYPPSYYPGAGLFAFSAGVAIGAAFWGDCNWGGNDIDIDVNRYNDFNRTNISNNNNRWNHNPDHRKGVQYRDNRTAQKFNKPGTGGAQNRSAYRGRDAGNRPAGAARPDQGRGGQNLGGTPGRSDMADRGGNVSQRDRSSTGGVSDRSAGFNANERPNTADRGSSTRSSSRGDSAFAGAGSSGSSARQHSDRGRTSRQSAGRSMGRPSGAGRGGGGGGRRR